MTAACVGAWLTNAARRLTAAGIEAGRREGRVLLASAMGVSENRLFSHPEAEIGPDAAVVADAMLERRLAGEPLSRIRGSREFWSLEFQLTPDTLDPRADSEAVASSFSSGAGAWRGAG